jgi:hypothetical protein
MATKGDEEGESLMIPVEESAAKITPVFWPADLLSKECPNARILVYGYDTVVTKYLTGATNKNSIVSHSKDLLHALSRERLLDRRLIFIAHSLGGIVVKEVSCPRRSLLHPVTLTLIDILTDAYKIVNINGS